MSVFSFGPFVLDVAERRLMHDGKPLAVTGKTFDVLRMLVEARGRLVGRAAFAARLWLDTTVEERNLTVRISSLRKILHAADATVDPVETVARVGYRLAVPVQDLALPGWRDRRLLSEIASLLRQAHEALDKEDRVQALRALTLFERVLALEPESAQAHAGLAATYLLLSSTIIRRPLPVEDTLRLARASAERALAIDGRQAEAWMVLGLLKMTYGWDWAGAETDLAQAVTVEPRSANAHEARARFLSAVGRHAEAVAAYTVASELAPRRTRSFERLGLGRWMAGDGPGALEALATASAIDPAARRPYIRRTVVLEQLRQRDAAMEARCTWLRLSNDAALAARLETLYRAGDHRAAMVAWIDRLAEHDQHFEAAIGWMGIGERGAALDALQHCLATQVDGVIFAAAFPSFHPLAGDPRYAAILKTIGLDRFATIAA
jgi:DNA-binding winged helix-turn-helix (wHTH) protein